MKHFLLLLCFVPVLGFSQSLSRQLYTRYFKNEFTFEPAFVRENKISSIVKREIESVGDSVTYNFVLEKTDFRKDGRPIKSEYWYNYHRNVAIKDFTYDSLNNLTEIRDWKPEASKHEPLQERSRVIYEYDSTSLSKVFGYRPENNGAYLVLSYCDSLAYKSGGKQVEIVSGRTAGSAPFSSNAKPTFPYPVIGKQVLNEEDSLKPIDKNSVWESEKQCNYKYRPALIKLTEITGIRCLPHEIVNTYAEMEKTVEDDQLIAFISVVDTSDQRYYSASIYGSNPVSDYSPDSLDLRTIIRIDLNNKQIQFQTASISRRPTSLEDYVTYTRTVSLYDFSMRLLWKDVYRADLGRNDFGFSNTRSEYKESQTVYDYYESGMLKREMIFSEIKPYAYNEQDGLYLKQVLYELTYFE